MNARVEIDHRRIAVVTGGSSGIGRHTAIRLAQRKARRSEDKKKEGLAAKKPRSGRPVTPRAIAAAIEGKEVTGPVKTRLLRAVNHLLEQKKQEPVQLAQLFELPKKGLPRKEKKAAAG